MNRTQRIAAFAGLGDVIKNLGPAEWEGIHLGAVNDNAWFTPDSVTSALSSLSDWLTQESLTNWTQEYDESSKQRRVAIVMAGNIPLVGFHDMLAVLISGHSAVVKLSSKDQFLPKWIVSRLTGIEPEFASRITFVEKLRDFDAVIATGSDNSARYFDYYFGKYPNIIRRNRTSVAVLTGGESTDEYERLGSDVFMYFGLGCRNVSKLFVPEGYSFESLFDSWNRFAPVINHHKYANNYDYQKSILLINRNDFLDTGFVLAQESDKIVSPISVLYYETYGTEDDLKARLTTDAEKIQVVVGNHSGVADVPFGAAQHPQLTDYADRVDVMSFLAEL